MLATLAATGLTYLACVLFFQAGKRRTQFAGVAQSERLQSTFRYGALAILFAALWLFSIPQGFERGVTVWLGAVSAAGGVSLLVSALAPDWHRQSAVVVLAFCLVAIVLLGLLGGVS
ncbi:MAG: hypothetical protein AAGJ32_01605 [Pseudomonadota bacterium]